MLSFDRKQHNSVKQLSFNKKFLKKKTKALGERMGKGGVDELSDCLMKHNNIAFSEKRKKIMTFSKFLWIVGIENQKKNNFKRVYDKHLFTV